MNEDPRPFLSVIAYPEGMGRAEVARLLAAETGRDELTLRLRLGKEPPAILGQVEPGEATRALRALRDRGGDAFAPTLGDLAALGPTMKIKDLRIEDGHLAADLWQGPGTVIRREDVQVLVRAHLSSKVTEHLPGDGTGASMVTRMGLGRHNRMLSAAGAMGLGLYMGGAYIDTLEGYVGSSETTITTSDKLDIHTRHGQVFQVDGDKFGFRVLGDLRGYGDKANMDRLSDLLAHICPDEIVDPYFSLWRAPSGADRLRLMPRDDNPVFAFYSRWAALMYRHLLGL